MDRPTVLAETLVRIVRHVGARVRRAWGWPWARLLVAMLWLGAGEPAAGAQLGAGPVDVSPLDFELNVPGDNLDDPCFWVDPDEPANSLLFMTAKDSGLVQVFRAATGTFLGSILGFTLPNNCAVEGDLLLTTDRGPPAMVRVHHLPDFTPVATF